MGIRNLLSWLRKCPINRREQNENLKDTNNENRPLRRKRHCLAVVTKEGGRKKSYDKFQKRVIQTYLA